MIVISKAILHIMDFNSGATIYSGAELDMGAPGTYDFLAGHIDKLFKDASAKTGQFLPESIFSQTASNYLDEHITFSDFSAGICKDAGFAAVSDQIEILGKLSVLFAGLPILLTVIRQIYGIL